MDVNFSESYFATGHKNGDIRLWSLGNDVKEVKRATDLHAGQISCIRFVPNGTTIVSASRTNGIVVIEQRNLSVTYTLEHPDMSIPMGCCKFAISPDGKYVAIGSINGVLFIFDIKLGEFVEAYNEQHKDTIVGVAWGPGQAGNVASIDKLGMLYMWS